MRHFFGQFLFGFGIVAVGLGTFSFMSNDHFFNVQAPSQVPDFVKIFWAIAIPGGLISTIVGARLLK